MSTYRELYMEGRNRLLAAGIVNAEGDARALLLYASGMSLNQLLLSYEDEVSEATGDRHQNIAERYLDMIDRRCAHVPLQYITHVQNFCGYDMYVDEHVLIPRQDTEILVEKVLDACGRREDAADDHYVNIAEKSSRHTEDTAEYEDYAADDEENGYGFAGCGEYEDHLADSGCGGYVSKNCGDAGKSLLDLCTGSGCIAIALKLLGDFDEVYGSDISPEALKIARRNAEANGAHVTFLESDMFQGVDGDIKFDVIVSNPPYIPDTQVDGLDEEVRNHEPRLALAGEADGLYFYRKIAREAGGYLKDGGRLFLEIGCDQGEAVSELLRAAGTASCECGSSVMRDALSDALERQCSNDKLQHMGSDEEADLSDDDRRNVQTRNGHYENIEITKDLAGLERVVSAIWRRTDA